jgi:8-oxo-dGTP pyrophosphatase MutT (NUDIX family)
VQSEDQPARASLLHDLHDYAPEDEGEASAYEKLVAFLQTAEQPLSRRNTIGHVTASAIIAVPDPFQFILIRHPKLGRWLQPGGHCEEEDETVYAAARREAEEETHLGIGQGPTGRKILDVDVHPIPARGTQEGHLHYDVRYLFIGLPRPGGNAAALQTAYVAPRDLASMCLGAELMRAFGKAERIFIGSRGRAP